MAYVIGIDTGGTYTDAVLLDMGRRGAESILRKSKALTTHSRLEEGIEGSLKGLGLRRDDIASIDKVVLSTTLATNAIVEGKLHRTGPDHSGRYAPWRYSRRLCGAGARKDEYKGKGTGKCG